MFEGVEVYCYTCGKYEIADKDFEAQECRYCGAHWLRHTMVAYQYFQGNQEDVEETLSEFEEDMIEDGARAVAEEMLSPEQRKCPKCFQAICECKEDKE